MAMSMTKKEQVSLFKKIIRYYDSNKKYRDDRQLPEMFEKYERFYRNDYWRGSGRPRHLSRLTSNLLFEGVEVMLPVVVSRPPAPDVTVVPSQIDPEMIEGMNDYASKMTIELKKVWAEDEMQSLFHQAFREFAIKGKCIVKSTFNPETGKIHNEIADILTCYPDRFCSSLDECENSHFIHAQYMKVSDIRKKYGIIVEPEGDFDENSNFIYFRDQIGGAISGAITRVRDIVTGDEVKSEGRSLVIEYYSPGADEYEEFEDYVYNANGTAKKDKQGNVMKKLEKRMKYPHGKICTIIRNYKEQIVKEEPNPYGRLPFFEVTNHKRMGDFWGMSDGQNIETHILSINQAMSNRNDNLRFLGNPDVEVVEGSGIDEVSNEPGAIYHSAIPNGIRKLPPPPMGSDVPRFIEDLRRDSDRIMGLSDAFRGQSMAGDSGVKTQALIAQATGRLQPKVMSFITLAKELYQHWAFIIQRYYPDMVIQQVQEGESAVNYQEFDIKVGAKYPIKVDVSTHTMLPFDKYAEFEEAQFLFQAGAMSPEQMIDTTPSMRDKQRAKDFVAEQKIQQQKQMEMEQRALEIEEQKKSGNNLSDDEQAILQSQDADAIANVLAKHPELTN